METLQDLFGRRIRLTDERVGHIVSDHDYMAEMLHTLGETLLAPYEIRRSTQDPETVRLYYKWYYGTSVGDKWVRVVVKILPDDAFVITAFASGKIEDGELLWTSGKDSN